MSIRKTNSGKGNIIERDEWQTPQSIFDDLNKQYDFRFDCCANIHNKKTLAFAKDFLQHNLKTTERVCWINPPFSKAYEMFEHFFKVVNTGVAIYRCDNMETALWQDVILKHCSWILIPKGRISYEGKDGKRSRFPSALIGFNVDVPKYIYGSILQNRK